MLEECMRLIAPYLAQHDGQNEWVFCQTAVWWSRYVICGHLAVSELVSFGEMGRVERDVWSECGRGLMYHRLAHTTENDMVHTG
jgi:hypothetical protein